MVNIGNKIEVYFPGKLLALVKAAGEMAVAKGQKLYIVGGAVRDLLMGSPNLDLDLVIEGDAMALARQLAKGREGKLVTHPRFGTATFNQGEFKLDIVTARSETYAEPGALPTVKPGTIKDDLFRRDFSINAMAVSLEPAKFGELVDPYGGKSDLDRHLIRVLHPRSFKDDPTRIWRAIRYEQRLGFRMEFDSEVLLRRDAAMMWRVSGDRLRHELERVLEEKYPEKCLYRADRVGALQQLMPSLKADGWLLGRFSQARLASAPAKPEVILYLTLLAWRMDEEELKMFVERLNFGGEAARAMRDIPGLKQDLPELATPEMKPSAVYRVLERHRLHSIQAAALAMESTLQRQRLELYLTKLRFIHPELNGNDLGKMGIPQGRKLGSMLRALKEARLDGMVKTRKRERELVRKWLAESKRKG